MTQPSVETKPEKVLIIRLGAFGDVLQSEGAIHDIRAHHPGASIAILTTPPFDKIFVRCPWIDRVLIDPRAPRIRVDRYLALIAAMRREGFDFIYDLQNSRRTLSYRRWIRSRWSQKDERQLQERQSLIGRRLSILERLGIQLEQAGVAPAHTRTPDVSWMAVDVSALLESAGIVGDFVLLIPGSSSKHRDKRWPYYAELAAALLSRGLTVATAPGPDEIDLCRALPGRLLLDGARPLDFFQLAGVLRRARFVIGNDTGPTHMAAYLGAKGLALFGPHVEARATSLDSFLEIIEARDLTELSWRDVFETTMAALAQG
jgi:ADP-heptose:LPS heptosyltransferase